MKRYRHRGRTTQRTRKASVLITVTIVSMFSMLLGVSLVTHYAVEEAKQVDESLAKVRVYWAHMGHVDYVLSKARQIGTINGGLCYGAVRPISSVFAFDDTGAGAYDATDNVCVANASPDFNPQRVGALWGIISELDNSTAELNGVPARRRWDYGNNYVLEFDLAALELEVDPRIGKVRLISDYVTPSIATVPPVIDGMPNRVRDYEVNVCFVTSANLTDPTATSCTAAQDIPGANHNDGTSRIVAAKRCFFSPTDTIVDTDVCDETP
jgi:hypothetical protein